MKINKDELLTENKVIFSGDSQEPIVWLESILNDSNIPYEISYSNGVVSLERKPPIDKYKIQYTCDVSNSQLRRMEFTLYLIEKMEQAIKDFKATEQGTKDINDIGDW